MQLPQSNPSSVTCGDSFPPRGSHMGGVPGRLALAQNSKEGSRPLPTNNREVSSYRQSTRLRQVCKGRIVASRGGYPVGCIVRMAATGGIYAAPTEYPSYCNCRKLAPHQSPAVTASPQGGSYIGGIPGRLALAQNSKEGSRPLPTNNREVSSYRQSTYFRQVCRGRIVASRGGCPAGCIVRMAATGGIYAAPTEYP